MKQVRLLPAACCLLPWPTPPPRKLVTVGCLQLFVNDLKFAGSKQTSILNRNHSLSEIYDSMFKKSRKCQPNFATRESCVFCGFSGSHGGEFGDHSHSLPGCRAAQSPMHRRVCCRHAPTRTHARTHTHTHTHTHAHYVIQFCPTWSRTVIAWF
jgi:hypothetical protein